MERIVDYPSNEMERLYEYANDPDFCTWYINEVRDQIMTNEFGLLFTPESGKLLVRSILLNNVLGVIDAIAGTPSDIEMMIDAYEFEEKANKSV